jgi:PAS domain S-box-containing protein
MHLPMAQPVASSTDKSSVSILVVDDNAAKRLALKAVLTPLGYPIVEADSGLAALRCLMTEDFAVILLDVCMPIMDGFETAALMRQRRQSEMTPIIFITAYASDALVEADRYAAGAADFIFGPVPPAELRAKVSVFVKLFVEADNLAERARAVQTYADQLRLLTDAAPIGIFQTDAENRYVYTNPRWTEITGIPSEAATGREWDTIIAVEQRAARPTSLAGGGGAREEFSHRFEVHPQGSEVRIVQVTSKGIPNIDGEIGGWVGTLADVTAEAGAEAAMSEARDTALLASAMQKNFAASASHELRTPTASILGFVEEMLENDALSAEDRGFLEIVYRNAQRLSKLIDDLLILDEPEIGASMMHPEPTCLAPLIARVMSAFSAAAQRADIALVADYEPDTIAALIDPLRMEQVLTNLIGNALKFTPRGGEVRVSARGGDEMVHVSVADTGMGIDPTDIDRIFDRFYRAKMAVATGVKGSGLGLAIAQRMIEAQNGQIRVTSTLGHGSTFTITLPVATCELQGV